jgi:hypothetical protein
MKAEHDLALVIRALRTYVAISKPLYLILDEDQDLASKLVDWATTIEVPFAEPDSGHAAGLA